LRAQLLEQFNRILETRDTPRGLVVNMGDVLFDFENMTYGQRQGKSWQSFRALSSDILV